MEALVEELTLAKRLSGSCKMHLPQANLSGHCNARHRYEHLQPHNRQHDALRHQRSSRPQGPSHPRGKRAGIGVPSRLSPHATRKSRKTRRRQQQPASTALHMPMQRAMLLSFAMPAFTSLRARSCRVPAFLMIHPFPRETNERQENPAKNRIGPPRHCVWLSGWRVSFFSLWAAVGSSVSNPPFVVRRRWVLLCWCHCEAESALTHVDVAA